MSMKAFLDPAMVRRHWNGTIQCSLLRQAAILGTVLLTLVSPHTSRCSDTEGEARAVTTKTQVRSEAAATSQGSAKVPQLPIDDWHWRYPTPSDRAPRPEDIWSIAAGAGSWVALSSAAPTGRILHSRGGILWESRPVEGGDQVSDVTWGDGRWVAVGRNGTSMLILNSTDGLNWERTLLPSGGDGGTLTEVHHGEGTFVALGYASWPARSTSLVIATSPDGRHWTQKTDPPLGVATAWGAYELTSGNGRFVRILWKNIPMFGLPQISTNATDWQAAPTNAPLLRCLTFGNGAFLAFGHGNKIQRSTDGVHWTEAGPVPTPDTDLQGTVLRFAGGRFYACSSLGLFTSETGETWSQYALPADVRILDLAGSGVSGGLCISGQRLTRLFPEAAPYGNGGVLYQVGVPSPVEFRLGPVAFPGSGSAYLAAQAAPGAVLELQRSTDLQQWTTIAEAANADGLVEFALPSPSTGTAGFLRALTRGP